MTVLKALGISDRNPLRPGTPIEFGSSSANRRPCDGAPVISPIALPPIGRLAKDCLVYSPQRASA